ncbi:PCI-domain-containing protein [Sistotremastrum niveocremeum HHB9708]|uniref:PCI-domain-containing protein n=2 Tax=Sistotremastraceae TaxID=3402574 RepID=A0A164XB29_9AGAM|nr:PCI-domain-containing protein [Sistotremastrum niveocremeum HHB9708]KZT35623.1 26S proteasome non-ATPase regulatory subunit 12 [Sistotremastrum suecicum HHB10207 ss-3]
MSEVKKQERDYTPEVDALLPDAIALADSGKVPEAIDTLLALEKQTRNASDVKSTTRLATTIMDIAHKAQDWDLVVSSLSLLAKKHGQLKATIQAIVEQAVSWLDEIKEKAGLEAWFNTAEGVRTVSEGRIFLERERARVTLMLAHYHEKKAETEGLPSLETASEMLSEMQVETYSSMERKEKTQFILEQMRLLMRVAEAKDEQAGTDGKGEGGGEAEWVKVRISGRKVNEAFLTEKENEELKLKYYELMIKYGLHTEAYLDVAKYWYKVWETPSIKSDEGENGKGWLALVHIACFVIVAPHNNEQSDMLNRLFVDPALKKLESLYLLVKCFTTKELSRWPGVESLYGAMLEKTDVFTRETPGGRKRYEDLHTRVIEHNIRVIARYYTRMTLARLTSLLDLSVEKTEETLSRLVVAGTVYARIDRPAGIIDFKAKRGVEDVMNEWSTDMQKLLGLVEKSWMGMNAAMAAQARV